MRALIIKNGVVETVSVVNSLGEQELAAGYVASPDGVGPGWIDNGDGTYSPPPTPLPTLEEAKGAKLAQLNTACSASINTGFLSGALGSDHRYDTDKPTDQVNLIAAGLGGVDLPFTCTDLATETKQQRPHTATQLAMVYTEASAEKVRLLGVLDVARTALNAIVMTTTLTAALAEVDAVTADFSLPT